MREILNLDALEDLVEIYVERHNKKQSSRFVSRDRLCVLMGVGPRTIKTWRTRGLPGIKIGQTVLYDLEAVERWVEEHA